METLIYERPDSRAMSAHFWSYKNLPVVCMGGGKDGIQKPTQGLTDLPNGAIGFIKKR